MPLRLIYTNAWLLTVLRVGYWVVAAGFATVPELATYGFLATVLAFYRLAEDATPAIGLLQDNDEEVASGLGTIVLVQVLIGIAAALTCYLTAPVIGAYFQDDRLITVLQFASPVLLVLLTGQVGILLLTRSGNFRRIYVIRWIGLAATVIGFCVGELTELASGILVGVLFGHLVVGLAYLWGARGILLSISFRWYNISRHLELTRRVIVERLASYVRREADLLLGAPHFAAELVGTYVFLRQLFSFAREAIHSPISEYATFEYARLHRMGDALAQPYRLITSAGLSVMQLVTVGAVALLPTLLAFYKPELTEVTTMLLPMALASLAMSVSYPTGALSLSTGRIKPHLWFNVIQAVLIVLALRVVPLTDMSMVAWIIALNYIFMSLLVYLIFARPLAQLAAGDWLRHILLPYLMVVGFASWLGLVDATSVKIVVAAIAVVIICIQLYRDRTLRLWLSSLLLHSRS